MQLVNNNWDVNQVELEECSTPSCSLMVLTFKLTVFLDSLIFGIENKPPSHLS